MVQKKIQLVPDNRIHGEGRVNVLGNKESRAQTDKWILSGLPLSCFLLESFVFSFSQDSRHGGTLSDLGKQGEVLGNHIAKASPWEGLVMALLPTPVLWV